MLIIDEGVRRTVTTAGLAGSVLIDPQELDWSLKPEGLCQGDVCVPRREIPIIDGRLELAELARLLGRPVVIDAARQVAALGMSASTRAEQLRSLIAPNFTLPGIDGGTVSLHDFDRRKRLLLAWSSW